MRLGNLYLEFELDGDLKLNNVEIEERGGGGGSIVPIIIPASLPVAAVIAQ